jgi:iron complex transport system ATP-binding protein
MAELLQVRGAAFGYDDREVFGGLDFEVCAGETLCILGANGCGKTTLLRCLGGGLRLKRGKIALAGRDLAALGPIEIARTMGFVFQEHSAPFPFPVLEVVRMGRAPYLSFLAQPSKRDTAIAEQALEMVGMAHLRDKPYTRISGGERQLVLIARTLAQQPRVILLDEPTSHLDFKNQALILKIVERLARQGLAIVMTTHMPNHALAFPSRVALMSRGKFVAVGDATTTVTEANLRATYDIDVRVLSAADPVSGQSFVFCVPAITGDGTP